MSPINNRPSHSALVVPVEAFQAAATVIRIGPVYDGEGNQIDFTDASVTATIALNVGGDPEVTITQGDGIEEIDLGAGLEFTFSVSDNSGLAPGGHFWEAVVDNGVDPPFQLVHPMSSYYVVGSSQ